MSSSDVLIRVEGLGKKYDLHHETSERNTALRDVLARKAKSAGRLLNPFTLAGQLCAAWRDAAQERVQSQEEFWALKDVSFEIRRGERVGIIGRNGAGKSTLLKILSRITEPTTGRVEIRGRVASLLEVGTGFHPELTGRENIYLNGAILGMTRREIKAKFDAIVDFAEVEKFLDMPVKRYSSGMYVRLAFAVAAHLDPDILIVDEVLAVGDAKFQDKCIGKIKNISATSERVVLFVSHQLALIQSLCHKCIYLDRGLVGAFDTTAAVIFKYQSNGANVFSSVDYTNNSFPPGDKNGRLLKCWIENQSGEVTSELLIEQSFSINIIYHLSHAGPQPYPNLHFYNSAGNCIFTTNPLYESDITIPAGTYIAKCTLPSNFFNDGIFSVDLHLTYTKPVNHTCFAVQSALCFTIVDRIINVPTRGHGYTGVVGGSLRPILPWSVDQTQTSFFD